MMESSSNFGAITELNLSSYQPYTLADRINSAVPGLKTSAAFLTFLRANLVLAHSSPPSTPALGPYPSHSLPTALFLSTLSAYPSPTKEEPPSPAEDDDIPPPSLEMLTSDADKATALRLIADSIVQQRHKAVVHLATHPLPLAVLLTVLAGIYRYYSYHVFIRGGTAQDDDFGAAFFLLATLGACAAYVGVIRSLTSGYLRAAEGLMAGDFLLRNSGRGSGGGYEDLVLATRLGNEIIGALVLRLERPSLLSSDSSSSSGSGTSNGGRHKRGHSRQNSLRSIRSSGKGLIRAWTTRLGYRGRGLGKDMLREAVRVTRERCGRDAEVGFAREHANSVKVLPEVFNRPFRRGEMRAARGLEKVVRELEAARERRRR
ncbi:hypothetical protein VTJ49DRAFT_7348 [Mycothermus thermophilus]|uniref:N-acetyltransferase domain-containing protein n=1 Tax=Humicola insolens TaxID=85995 RepID=A0ABR3VH29_HUMIN